MIMPQPTCEMVTLQLQQPLGTGVRNTKKITQICISEFVIAFSILPSCPVQDTKQTQGIQDPIYKFAKKMNIFMAFAWSCPAQTTRWSQQSHYFPPISFESVDIFNHQLVKWCVLRFLNPTERYRISRNLVVKQKLEFCSRILP